MSFSLASAVRGRSSRRWRARSGCCRSCGCGGSPRCSPCRGSAGGREGTGGGSGRGGGGGGGGAWAWGRGAGGEGEGGAPRGARTWARSETPFSVMTRSGFTAMISSQTAWMWSSSWRSSSSHALSSVSRGALRSGGGGWSGGGDEGGGGWGRAHLDVPCDSPFLYSRVQSRRRIRGFSMRRRILPWTTSLLNMTPLSTRESSMSPPGIFSTLAYLQRGDLRGVRCGVWGVTQSRPWLTA